MEPIPASVCTSITTSCSMPNIPSSTAHTMTMPLTSLYVISGVLPLFSLARCSPRPGLSKSPHTWQLADTESVFSVHHSEGAISRFWQPEVLSSTVTPHAGGSKPCSSSLGHIAITVASGSRLFVAEVGRKMPMAVFSSKELGDHEMLYLKATESENKRQSLTVLGLSH